MLDNLKVLFVDDQPLDVMVEEFELRREGLKFLSRTASKEAEFIGELADFKPHVILCDYSMPGFSGLRALEIARQMLPDTPVIMVSGAIAEYTAVECLSHGATDYLLKSSLRRLGPAVRRAVTETLLREEMRERIAKLTDHQDPPGLRTLDTIARFANDCRERARGQGRPFAVVNLNLDQFRYVEEEFGLGRQLVDAALKDINAGLQSASGYPNCVARMGFAEFLVIVSDVQTALQVSQLVQRLLDAIARPRRLSGRKIRITATAGVALYPKDGDNFDLLSCKASSAMREAELSSPGGFQFYWDDLSKRTQQRRQLEADLRDAISGDELSLFYQPQFSMQSGQVCGVEALARWFRADGSAIAPSVFIPMAERGQMISSLGSWALKTGCRTVAAWPGGDAAPPLCVNVSAHQICPAFSDVIAEALAESGLSPQRLELEITESVFLENSGMVLECLHAWKQLGVRIALDDFGTGYSNLACLSRLPIDRLKIDRSLIRGVRIDSREAAIVRTVVGLGRDLGFTVIAEGVETEDELRLVQELGCHQAQGFLLMPPAAPADACAAMDGKWGLYARGGIFDFMAPQPQLRKRSAPTQALDAASG